jgi:hypothetical protein
MTIRDKFNIHGRSKETKSPLAPQSDDEVAKKESDNTKSKKEKMMQMKKKQIKPRLKN